MLQPRTLQRSDNSKARRIDKQQIDGPRFDTNTKHCIVVLDKTLNAYWSIQFKITSSIATQGKLPMRPKNEIKIEKGGGHVFRTEIGEAERLRVIKGYKSNEN